MPRPTSGSALNATAASWASSLGCGIQHLHPGNATIQAWGGLALDWLAGLARWTVTDITASCEDPLTTIVVAGAKCLQMHSPLRLRI